MEKSDPVKINAHTDVEINYLAEKNTCTGMSPNDPIDGNASAGVRVADGILLLDRYDEMADMLKQSFRCAGFAGPVVVIEDKGFLPPDVLSVFRWFCRNPEKEESGEKVTGLNGFSAKDRSNTKSVNAYRILHAGWKAGSPRYFNQIELPDYWEISSTGSGGEIHDLHHLRGRIFYAQPAHRRLVSEVDWLDDQGIVRCTDHYDCHGLLYARTVFNRSGKRFCRSWFNDDGQECVVENDVTGDIIVTRNHKTYIYKNRTDLVIEMLRELKADGQRIFYNSLSTPLFVSERFPSDSFLFWQEGPREDIPGNMQMILNGHSHTRRIFVQNPASRQKLIKLGAPKEWVRPLGFVYPFERENHRRPDILICTNSDQIEELEVVVKRLPQMVFHIAAVTDMSARLLAFGRYPNVRLYPVVKEKTVNELFRRCDYYFDINHGGEILSSVRRAFLNNQLVLGFEKTIHQRRYVAKEHIFHDASDLCSLAADPDRLPAALSLQHQAAMSERTDTYRELFERQMPST